MSRCSTIEDLNDITLINVVHRDKPAGAIAHAGNNTELHYIIEGSATVVTGGKLVRGATAGAGTIDDGVTRHVSKGDVVIVPENSAHWYKEIDGAITYLEVRWLAPKSGRLSGYEEETSASYQAAGVEVMP